MQVTPSIFEESHAGRQVAAPHGEITFARHRTKMIPTARSAAALLGVVYLLTATCGGAFGQPAQATHTQDSTARATTYQEYLSKHDVPSAIKELNALSASRPNDVDVQGNLGVLLFFTSRCDEATVHLSRALDIEPNIAKLRALLGICQQRQGLLGEAQGNLEAVLASSNELKLRVMVENSLVQTYYRQGDLTKAATVAEQLVKDDPSSPDGIYLTYRIHKDIAERARKALSIIGPDSAQMHILLAEAFINIGDAQNALLQYERALSVAPDLPGIRYELAEAVLADSQSSDSLEKASKLLHEALIEDPHNAGAEAKLGSIAAAQSDQVLAEKHYQRALDLDPHEVTALKGLAEIAEGKNDDSKASEYLLRVVASDPLDDKSHYQLSLIYRRAHRDSDADRELHEFLRIRELNKKSQLGERRIAP